MSNLSCLIGMKDKDFAYRSSGERLVFNGFCSYCGGTLSVGNICIGCSMCIGKGFNIFKDGKWYNDTGANVNRVRNWGSVAK